LHTNSGWHVHTLGDVSANDGTATGGHFPGSCNACRPAGAPEQTAGLIADGAAITSAGGLAEATVKDTVVKLTGANSIIGRSIVIHGNAGDSGARVAQCVIGINEKAEPVPASASPDDGRAVLGTKVTKATCVFASAVPGAPAITGTATFTATAPTANCGAYETSMTLDVTGLAPGDHTAHVHQSGNVGSTGATDTLGHFVGVCNNCRAQTSLSEVGSFNDGQAFTADAQGKATLTLVDQSMTFSGYNSIIGRSIVIHGDGTTPGARVAQCAIGIAEEKALPDLAPCGGAPVVVDTKRTKAVCTFAETFNNGGTAITGQMSFVATDSTHSSFDVSYDISGLSDGTHGFHVHTLGDLSDPVAAMATGGHFKGDCDSCRPAGSVEQTVGLLGNGQAPITSAGGSAKGTFNDKVIRFAGTNSIIGRSIVIHGNAVDAGARVAQCVVGLDEADEPGSELSSALFETQEARCELRAVSGTASLSDPKNTMVPSGSVIFEMDRDARKTRVIYTMRNLPAGENSWHVHQAGNLLDAKATLGHFVGGCDTDKCRPDGVTQEVGMIGNGDKVYVSDFGAASGYFHDAVLELNGPKSIVGRSVVVHGPDGARLMSCVIGRTQEGTRTASRPEPTAAKCFLRASRFFTGGTSAANVGYEDINLGYLDITERPTTGELEFKYYVEGLSDGAHQFHVHDWGNVLSEDASATGPHFVGRCGGKCRPEGVLQEVGMLQDGKNITASNAIAQGTFVDTVAKLSGPNSIIGRSIVIHGNSSSTGARIAMCVVGVAETNEPSTIPYFAAEEPATVTEAFCHIRPFRPNAPADKTKQVTGTIRFRGGAAPGVSIDYYVAQLPAGPHSWHVHQAGDISDSAAMATLGHFQGACKGCRPAGVTDEVGAIADGAAIIADPHGIAVGKASDGVVSLNGVNSIIGRSIVIHGDGTEAGKGVRIAQCVIGISRETRSSIDIATAAAQSERNSLEAEIAAARAEADAKASSSKATVAGLAIATGVCAIGAVGAIAFAVTKKGVPAGTNRV
jgi:Cu-Zn family superoxide dismutase